MLFSRELKLLYGKVQMNPGTWVMFAVIIMKQVTDSLSSGLMTMKRNIGTLGRSVSGDVVVSDS